LQTTLGATLIATKGHAAVEVEHAYNRARVLCEQVGDTVRLLPVLVGLRRLYLVRAELLTARQLGEQLVTLAQQSADVATLIEASFALGITLFYLGEFQAARTCLERGIALYDAQQHRLYMTRYGQDVGCQCLAFTALTLWLLGYPEQAIARSQAAVALAQQVDDPHNLVMVLTFTSWLQQFCGNLPEAFAAAKASTALATTHGFASWAAMGRIVQGWVRSMQIGNGTAIPQMLADIEVYRAAGAVLMVPYFLGLIAEVAGHVGQEDIGPTCLTEA
jgi:predicted ATPase